MFLRILLIATAISSGLAQNECTSVVYMSCQAMLNTALNISNTQPWLTPIFWRDDFELYFRKGFTGTRALCSAFEEFKACLDSSYTACTSADFFIQRGANVNDAYIFASAFNDLLYTCEDGFEIISSNEGCFRLTWVNFGSNLRAIRQAWESMTKILPEMACSYGKDFVDGFEETFGRNCGIGNQAAISWGCEYALAEIFTRSPQCSLACTLPSAESIEK
ncbi:unnamed protein product, partial [Mesorhabditis belari]|uniref:Uncharacterized protein n=1 Tax=Mesorhabditis belari TaxID=2138241 RepID=A0AAF3FKQ1_9BILA